MRVVKKLAIGIALASSLVACSNSELQQHDPTVAKAAIVTCGTAGAAITAITPFVSKFSEDERKSIAKAIEIIQPICTAPTPPTAGTLQQAALEGAMQILVNAQQQALVK